MKEMKTSRPLVSVIIVTYNSAQYIEACIRSVLKLTWKPIEIIVYDNNSLDATTSLLSAYSQSISIVKSAKNIGYAGGNNAAVHHARGEYILILNPDTVIDPDCIRPLVRAIEQDRLIAACQPAVYLMKAPHQLNLTGKLSHYLGFDWLRDYQSVKLPLGGEIQSLSGSCFLMRRNQFQKIGGFDELFFLYFEDTDLSWRLRQLGFKLMFVPTSKLYHDYKFVPESNTLTLSKKIFYYERNRHLLLLKNYSARTYCLLLPMIIFTELGMIAYCTMQGALAAKLRTYPEIIRCLSKIMQARSLHQKQKKMTDAALLQQLESKISFSLFDTAAIRIVLNPLSTLYHKLILRIVT